MNSLLTGGSLPQTGAYGAAEGFLIVFNYDEHWCSATWESKRGATDSMTVRGGASRKSSFNSRRALRRRERAILIGDFKMKRFLLVAISAVAIATPSLADNNENSLAVTQAGHNTATVEQVGNWNTSGASISQLSLSNTTLLHQSGEHNTHYSEITQKGSVENLVDVVQTGLHNENTAVLTQDGQTNKIDIEQHGMHNMNWAQVTQTGNGNLSTITQK
jgi:hypothetical protein